MRGLKKVIQKKLFIYLGNMIELPPLLSMVFDNGNMILLTNCHVNEKITFFQAFFGILGNSDRQDGRCVCLPYIYIGAAGPVSYESFS